MNLSPRDALLFSIAALNPEIAHLVVPIREPLLSTTILRDYQFEMLSKAATLMRQGCRRILLQLPTGGGKTVMAAQMLRSAAACGLASQFIVHRKELIDQTSRTFTGMGIDHGFIAAGRPLSLDALVTLSGVQTLAGRLDLVLPPNLAVLDEAHHATAATWEHVLAAYSDGFTVGLTATPERLDGRGLSNHFDAMIEGPTVAELIRRKFLSPYDYYAPSRPDLDGIHTVAGDYNRGEVTELMDRPELVGDIVKHYLRLAAGKQGIVFAASREHSRNLAAAFQAAGVRADHVDGSLPDKERDHIVDSFREGGLDIMCNVDLFGEGFDVPGIVYAGLARPTKSLALHLQQVGRALRVVDGKARAVICDHAGNAFVHGMPDDPREWSLEGRAARQPTGVNDDAEPVRQCLTCFRVYPSVVKACPGCGAAQTPTPREIKIREGELEKLEKIENKKQAALKRKAEEQACKGYADYLALAQQRNYPKAHQWARTRASMKQGSFPFR